LAIHSKQQQQTLWLLLLLPLKVHQQQAVTIWRLAGPPPTVVMRISKVSLQDLKQN